MLSRRRNRCLEAARNWSTTATADLPQLGTGMARGGAATGAVDSGTTKTVRRRSLTMFDPTTRQGRVFLISEPIVGSRRTPQTSPRSGVIPRLQHLVREDVPIFFDRCNCP